MSVEFKLGRKGSEDMWVGWGEEEGTVKSELKVPGSRRVILSLGTKGSRTGSRP